MENVNAGTVTVATETVKAVVDAPAAEAVVATNEAPTSMKEKENDWFCAPNVAAIAAATTAVITMIGKDQVSVGSVVGAAAGVGSAYLGTKWLTEAMGIENHGLGKAFGLFVGIDLGYAMTNLGSKMSEDRAAASVQSYL